MALPGLLVASNRNPTHCSLRKTQIRTIICFLTRIWKIPETTTSGMARSRVSTMPTRNFLSLFFHFFFLYFPSLLRYNWHITLCKLLPVSFKSAFLLIDFVLRQAPFGVAKQTQQKREDLSSRPWTDMRKFWLATRILGGGNKCPDSCNRIFVRYSPLLFHPSQSLHPLKRKCAHLQAHAFCLLDEVPIVLRGVLSHLPLPPAQLLPLLLGWQ